MPKEVILDQLRTKSKFTLPFSKAEIEMWDYPLVGDVTPNNIVLGQQPQIKPLDAVLKMIVSWSFVDLQGNQLPITEENLRKMPMPDFILIAEKVEKASQASSLSVTEKKVTPDSST